MLLFIYTFDIFIGFISFRLHSIVVLLFGHAPLCWKATAYHISNLGSLKYDLMVNTYLCH
jgi:hypothetical protein